MRAGTKWGINYTKEHMRKAKEKGRTAFAIGFNGPDRGEAFLWLEDEAATTLWLMVHKVSQGMTAHEALDSAERSIADWKAKKAALATEAAS